MSTTLERQQSVQGSFEPTFTRGPYVVATDGSARADGALRAAMLLAERTAAAIGVVTVLPPLPVVPPEVALPVTPELEATRRADLIALVREQFTRVFGNPEKWALEVSAGSPPSAIERIVRDANARLVIVGLGRHGIVDRLFGDETALKLLRVSTVPVLAVPAGFVSLPTRALAAVDFSAASVRSARAAIELLGDSGTLFLAHVVSRELESGVWEAMREDYTESIRQGFEQLKAQLEVPPGIHVDTVILRGDPAHEILQFASGARVELIASGSHGHGFFSRLLLGSVASKLLRGATCAVLGVPRPTSEELEHDDDAAGSHHSSGEGHAGH